MSSLGPYIDIAEDKIVEYPNGEKLRFAIYGAFNAYGLIGTECNGIVVLDEKNLKVVCDEIAISNPWSSMVNSQVPDLIREVFNWLTTASFEDVAEFINKLPRSRYPIPLMPEKKVRKTKKQTFAELKQWLDFPRELSYNTENKEAYAQTAQAALKYLSKELELKEVKIRFNPGGIAVAGDATLMGMWGEEHGIYINISPPSFMYRTIKHMKDYTGGRNQFIKNEELLDFDTVVQKLKSILQYA